MQDQIRQAVGLSEELEERLFEMQHEAFTLLERGKQDLALAKIEAAWALLPEPKYNTSCSHTILCDLIDILTVVGHYEEAHVILAAWRLDQETAGFKIFDTTAFILSAENFLFLNDIDAAIACFRQANAYGATKRDFSGRPAFYMDIAQGLLTESADIRDLFAKIGQNSALLNPADSTLSSLLHEQVESHIEIGNAYFDDALFLQAIDCWKAALQIIPFPQNVYSETQWLEVAIADAYFLLGDFPKALLHLERAKENKQAIAYENPFIMLRLGQCLLEHQRDKEAAEFLQRAYMFEGQDIFADEDPKYFDFLKMQVQLD